jgi:hypothetical protein
VRNFQNTLFYYVEFSAYIVKLSQCLVKAIQKLIRTQNESKYRVYSIYNTVLGEIPQMSDMDIFITGFI